MKNPAAENTEVLRFEHRVALGRVLVYVGLGAAIVPTAALLATWLGWSIPTAGEHGAVWLGCAFVSTSLLTVFVARSAQRDARSMGTVEVYPRGLRWRRDDGFLGFDARWNEIDRVLVRDRGGESQMLVVPLDGAPLWIRASGFIELERMRQLEAHVAGQVRVEPWGPEAISASRHAEELDLEDQGRVRWDQVREAA